MALPSKVFLRRHLLEVGEREDQVIFPTGVYQRNDGLFEAVLNEKTYIYKGLACLVSDVELSLGLHESPEIRAKFKLDGFDVQDVVLKPPLFHATELTFVPDPQSDYPVHLFDESRRQLRAQFFDAGFYGRELTPPCNAICDIYGLDEQRFASARLALLALLAR
jgi:hypothetical protein